LGPQARTPGRLNEPLKRSPGTKAPLAWGLEAYFQALESSGFVVEALTEPTVDEGSIAERAHRARWRRLPLFLDVRARKR